MKKRKVAINVKEPHEATPLPIVADAAIATVGVGDGRLIPLVIVDTTARQDVEELIRVHEYSQSGDVNILWTQLEGRKGTIALVLTFIRPAEITIIVEFDIVRHSGLVELILTAKGIYIQPGQQGDRFSVTMDHPRILVDIGDSGFQNEWDDMLRKSLIRHYRDLGLNRKESKQAAEQFTKTWREMIRLRVNR